MAGHSHWANIQHKKGAADAKRGKLWSKLARAIIIAAKHGGGDPSMNLKLRYAIDKAKQGSMPKDTIEKAIKKGTGELGAENYESATYEGYAPGGIAILVEALTNNRARTAPEMRSIFEKAGGNLATSGSVAFQFSKQGIITIQRLLADSHDFQATGNGTVGFDRTLNLALNLNLTPALSQKIAGSSPVAKVALKDGRLRLPLLITGTVQNPSYGLDTKAFTGKLQEQAKEKAKATVEGLLQGTTKPSDLKKEGENLLKGLLGR